MKRKILSALAALAALAFASCSSFSNDEQTEEITGTNAYVKISLADSSRMALPVVSNAGEFTRFTLTGTTATANAAPVSETTWETSGTESAYAKMTAANIAVTVGASYTFTLAAEKGGAKWQGSTATTIAQGANNLNFALELASISTEGTGSLSVTLTVPAAVQAVDAALKNPAETSTLTSEGASLPIAEGKAVYTRSSIASGNYVLVFTLYGDTAKTLKLGEWREYAGIADGLTSSSSPEIAGNDDLSSIYEINLTYNGGTLSGTVPGSYTRFSSTITLPTASGISRTNYDFEGWYDAQTGGNKVETIPSGSTGNKTLYARWTPDANLTAANAVTEKINAIGTVTYTTDCKTKIDAARTDYNALTEAQKALVSAETLAVLTNAETTYASLFPFPFKSFTIPAAGISKSGATINATIKADNFANLNIDFSKFTASCSADPSITTGAVFTKVSDTEIQASFKIPGTAGEYSITVSYGSNSKTGTLKVQDFSAYKVGDVLMNDGTIERYSETPSFTAEQKSKAVGVMYAFNEYGVPAGWLGIHNSFNAKYAWAKDGTTGWNTDFTDIRCTPIEREIGAADSATFTGDTDGSDNWAYICSQDSTASENAGENYPAFDYVNKYATTFNLTDDYATGWYMPSIAELAYIYRNWTTLNAVLEALGEIPLEMGPYWSSSQSDGYDNMAWLLDFRDGGGSFLDDDKDNDFCSVCCVRAFSN